MTAEAREAGRSGTVGADDGEVVEGIEAAGVGVAMEAAVGAIDETVNNLDLEAGLAMLVLVDALDAAVVAPARSQGFGGDAIFLFHDKEEVFLTVVGVARRYLAIYRSGLAGGDVAVCCFVFLYIEHRKCDGGWLFAARSDGRWQSTSISCDVERRSDDVGDGRSGGEGKAKSG